MSAQGSPRAASAGRTGAASKRGASSQAKASGAPRSASKGGRGSASSRKAAAPSHAASGAKSAKGRRAKSGAPASAGRARRVAQAQKTGSKHAASAPAKQGASRGFTQRALGVLARSYLARFAAVLAVAVTIAFVANSVFFAHSGSSTLRADGLPAYITDDMVDAARAMQQEYGHPAGCTIAQIIQESGQGDGLSALASRDNNLFGMKWADSFAGKPGVKGPVDWGTNEEYDGATVSITGTFIAFESQKACIEFRSSVFLQASTYADNPTIRRAVETRNSALMAWGLQDAGWATDSSYAESLVLIMEQYDLYRFDS